jgi:hypothetical protein
MKKNSTLPLIITACTLTFVHHFAAGMPVYPQGQTNE